MRALSPVWHVRDNSVPWVAAFSGLMVSYASEYAANCTGLGIVISEDTALRCIWRAGRYRSPTCRPAGLSTAAVDRYCRAATQGAGRPRRDHRHHRERLPSRSARRGPHPVPLWERARRVRPQNTEPLTGEVMVNPRETSRRRVDEARLQPSSAAITERVRQPTLGRPRTRSRRQHDQPQRHAASDSRITDELGHRDVGQGKLAARSSPTTTGRRRSSPAWRALAMQIVRCHQVFLASDPPGLTSLLH